ncbi:glucan 1,4-alpha-glucosidase [Cytophagales bacterium WSM2-2]|nr:glucan 1,4-alpha-glucosidase [Cytophagales bacterium WSM2-2]
MKRFCLLTILLFVSASLIAQTPDYKNPKLPTGQRVKDLLSRMTPEEKFWQLFMIPGDLDSASPDQYKTGIFGFQVSVSTNSNSAAQQMLNYNTKESGLQLVRKINSIQKYFVEQSRLGIPIIAFDEALHGLVRDGATAFPQSIALAATFDTALMKSVATAIARETKARGIRQVLSPVVNIATDVRWGRVEETYGEDPFLTSEMGNAFVSAFEKMNIVTTPKHFVANVGDGGRDSYPVHASERFMEEIHFPPFKSAFQKGGSRSVMTSYNSYDGVPSTSNSWLLTKKLKDEWKFKGFVISDAGAVGGSIVLHNTASDYSISGEQAINAGLDVIFQTQYEHYKLFIPSFLDGRISKQRIDDAVSRVLTAKFELGLFENPYVSEEIIQNLSRSNSSKLTARRAAQESVVLLKNEKNILPLSGDLKSIAVIGEDAIEGRLGGYSGPGNGVVNLLDGIKKRLPNARINFANGCGRKNEEWRGISPEYLSSGDKQGLKGEYFNNVSLEGAATLTRQDPTVDFHWTLYSPDKSIRNGFYSVRWSGKIRAPQTGNTKIGLEGNDGFRLYVDNKLIVDNWKKESYRSLLADFYFEKDKTYDLRIEFFEPVGNAHIKLVWNVDSKNDWKGKIEEAVKVAQQSDVAIVVAGIREGEFQDRALLTLPGHQEEMINKIAATGKPVVVVIVGGSAVVMQNWISNVPGILDVWYPGEEGGNAVAAVLLGDVNPSGRLPITFPVHESQLPLTYNHKPTGRGDDYNDLSGEPLFPFGFGLSYTQFQYTNIHLDENEINANQSTRVSIDIENTGTREGDEVIQLYVKDELASIARPVLELKAFNRIHLQPKQKKRVTFEVTPEMLSMLNKEMQWVVEPGEFALMIGASSKDIRQVIQFRIR